MPELKNKTFIKNIVDPKTGKQVKKIYQIKVSKLIDLLNHLYGNIIKKSHKYIHFGDPIIYIINTIDDFEQVDN